MLKNKDKILSGFKGLGGKKAGGMKLMKSKFKRNPQADKSAYSSSVASSVWG